MNKNIVKLANAWLEWQSIEGMDLPYFKITFDDEVDGQKFKFRVVPAGKFNGKILESLRDILIEKGMSKREASIQAARTCNDFYSAADKLSKEGIKPFKVYITKSK